MTAGKLWLGRSTCKSDVCSKQVLKQQLGISLLVRLRTGLNQSVIMDGVDYEGKM